MRLGHAIGTPGKAEARRQGDRAAGSPAMGWFARAGLVARGVVYGIIGVLALKLALGDGGKATNQTGALRAIAGGGFGRVLLIALAIGLGGYALWRLTRALVGHGREQSDDGSDRIAALASGIAYAILCVTAIKILSGARAGSGTPKKATGGVLDWNGGRAIVIAAGLILFGVAAYQAYKGIAKKFLEDSRTEAMTPAVERAFTTLGVVGHVARAVVFTLIGYGLIKAAIDYDAKKAVGLDGALRKLAHAPAGPTILGIVAAGLVGFAVYSVVDARYRRV